MIIIAGYELVDVTLSRAPASSTAAFTSLSRPTLLIPNVSTAWTTVEASWRSARFPCATTRSTAGGDGGLAELPRVRRRQGHPRRRVGTSRGDLVPVRTEVDELVAGNERGCPVVVEPNELAVSEDGHDRVGRVGASCGTALAVLHGTLKDVEALAD